MIAPLLLPLLTLEVNGVKAHHVDQWISKGHLRIDWQEPTGSSALERFARANVARQIEVLRKSGAHDMMTSGGLTDQRPDYTIDISLKVRRVGSNLVSVNGSDVTWPGSASMGTDVPIGWNYGLIGGRPALLTLGSLLKPGSASRLQLNDLLQQYVSSHDEEFGLTLHHDDARVYAKDAFTAQWNVTSKGIEWLVLDEYRRKSYYPISLSWSALAPILAPRGPLGRYASAALPASAPAGSALRFGSPTSVPTLGAAPQFGVVRLDHGAVKNLDQLSQGWFDGKRLVVQASGRPHAYSLVGRRLVDKGIVSAKQERSSGQVLLSSPTGNLLCKSDRLGLRVTLLNPRGKAHVQVLSDPRTLQDPVVVQDRPGHRFWLVSKLVDIEGNSNDGALAVHSWSNGRFVQTSFTGYSTLGMRSWARLEARDLDGDGRDEMIVHASNGESETLLGIYGLENGKPRCLWAYKQPESSVPNIVLSETLGRSPSGVTYIAGSTLKFLDQSTTQASCVYAWDGRSLEKVHETPGGLLAVGDLLGDGTRQMISELDYNGRYNHALYMTRVQP